MFSAKRTKEGIVEVSFDLKDTDGWISERSFSTTHGLLTAIAWQVLTSKDPKILQQKFAFASVEFLSPIKVSFYPQTIDPPEQA